GLVHAAGFAVTVRGANDVGQTVRAIVDAVPVLGQDHEVRANGLVVSRVGMYRVVWGGRSQPVSAPPAAASRSLSSSAGVLKLRVRRGRSFKLAAISLSCG